MKIASTSLLFMAICASAVSAQRVYKYVPLQNNKFDMIGRAFDDVVSNAKENGIVDKAKIDTISGILGDLVTERKAKITVNKDMFVESESNTQCRSYKKFCSKDKGCCSGYCRWAFPGIGLCAER